MVYFQCAALIDVLYICHWKIAALVQQARGLMAAVRCGEHMDKPYREKFRFFHGDLHDMDLLHWRTTMRLFRKQLELQVLEELSGAMEDVPFYSSGVSYQAANLHNRLKH
jgi:hypothetical protein